MRTSASTCFPGVFTCLILSITTALFLVWTLQNSECSFAKGAFCLRSWDGRSIHGHDTSNGVELQPVSSTMNNGKSGALRLSATLDRVREQNEKEVLLMEANNILERTADLEREFAPQRDLKSSKSEKSSKSDKSSKKSKKSKRKSYVDDDDFVLEVVTNSTSYDTKSRKSSKKFFRDSNDSDESKKPDRVFVVILSDFSDASARDPIESFGTSEIMEKDITLLLTVPSDTDIYLIEGIVETLTRHRNLIAASDFTCPPSSYDKHVKDASGRLFFRIPGDVNSVTVFCDDDENVIGIYVHIVYKDGEQASPGATPAPVTAVSPTAAPPTSQEPTSEAVDVTPVPTVDTNVTLAPTVAFIPEPTLAVVATPSPTVTVDDETPVPTVEVNNTSLRLAGFDDAEFDETEFDLFI